MTPDTVPYPPGPDPETLSLRFTRMPRGVRVQQGLLVFGLLLILFAYVAIMTACLGLAGVLAFQVAESSTLAIIAESLGIAVSLTLFAVMFKKIVQPPPTPRPDPALEVSAESQPGLFAFLQRISDDAGASLPRKVLVTADANACMIPVVTWRNLIAPPTHDLAIGLGLVNAMNLSELQAVLAHEFGHVAERNPLAAWAFGVELLIGRLFSGSRRKALTAGSRHLSREREYQADRYAATIAGSPAAISALTKASFASETLSLALTEAQEAADRKHYTSDLFFHQHASAAGRELPQFFADTLTDHPSPVEREERLRNHLIEASIDPRTSWILFNDAGVLRQRVTTAILKTWPGVPKHFTPTEARTIQKLIDEERRMPTMDPRYRGAYDERRIALQACEFPDLQAMVRSEPWSHERIRRVEAKLYEEIPFRQAKRGRMLAQRRNLLECIVNTRDLDKLQDFDHRVNQFDEWFRAFDRRVAALHLQMATDEASYHDLVERYRFHLTVQAIAPDQVDTLRAYVRLANGNDEAEFFRDFVEALRRARTKLESTLTGARRLAEPAIRHFPFAVDLPNFLLDEAIVGKLPAGPLSSQWIAKLIRQLVSVERRFRKLERESLVELLKAQESIRTAWLGRYERLTPVSDPLTCPAEPV